MTDISKGRLMSGKTFTDTNYKRLKKSNDGYKKKIDKFWWHYVFDRNK